MALTRLQEEDLDRWIQNGRSWTDETQPRLEEGDYACLDEDCMGMEEYDMARYEDLYDD